MGLFNRNKGDAPAPAAPEAGTPPADTGTFDFDAISRDLDAHNGASSFDALLAAPATTAPQPPTDNSAFDFPDDPLGLSAPPQNAVPATASVPIAATPESVLNAPMNPTMPTTGVAPLEPLSTAPTAPVNIPKAKKSLPLVPLLGALGLLAVAGGGAMLLHNSNQNTEPADVPAPPPLVHRSAPGAPSAATAPGTPGIASAPGAPPAGTTTVPGAPAVPPGAPPPAPRSASPGIAPATATGTGAGMGAAPKPPAPSPKSATATGMNASAGQSVATAPKRAPAATTGLDPTLVLKLKQLWKTGADAKHKGDFKTARAAWTEALKLKPDHPGFQDSINQLPH